MRNGIWGVGAALLLAAGPAMAADAHRLAYSERLGVEVFAQPDAAGNWCRPALALSLMLKDGSSLLQGGIADFIPKLGPVLAQECPAAISLTAAAYKASDRSVVGGALTATKAGNWAAVTGSGNVAVGSVPPAPPAPPVPSPVAPPVTTASARDLADPVGYWPLLAHYSRENSSAANDTSTLKAYASVVDCRNFRPVANNEFRLADYLAKVKAQLLSELVKPYFRFAFDAPFGQYNPATGAFEFSPLAENVAWDQPFNYCAGDHFKAVVRRFTGSWVAGKSIYGLPVSAQDAEALVEYINRRRYGDRRIYLEIIAKPVFEPATPDGNAHLTLELLEATAYQDKDSAKVLHTYSAEELANAAKVRAEAQAAAAEAKRLADEAQAKQRAAAQQRYQAEADLRTLASSSRATRIAYFHDGSRALSSVSTAIGRSLVQDRPQAAVFMVKAGSSGSSGIEAAWPSRLKLDLAGGLPELVKGRWYVVSGDLNAEKAGGGSNGPYVGHLAVRAVSECQKDGCADADDVPAIVHKRYPDLPLQSGSLQ